MSRRVTASPSPLKSCVGVAQGCQWWSSSELLPATTSPRAPRPISAIVNTSDDPDDVGGNAVIGAAGRSFGVRNLDNSIPGAAVVAHENVALRLSAGNTSQRGLFDQTAHLVPDLQPHRHGNHAGHEGRQQTARTDPESDQA